jgi:hypothetical protein
MIFAAIVGTDPPSRNIALLAAAIEGAGNSCERLRALPSGPARG